MDVDTVTLRAKVKQLALEWISTSTSHGLPSVFRVERLHLKLIWFMCFVTSTVLCSYIIIQSFLGYYDYQVTVSTTMVNQLPMVFPAVTFCNLNPFYKNRSFWFVNSTLHKVGMGYALNLRSLNRSQSAMDISKNAMEYLKVDAAVRLTSENRTLIGFSMQDMLISCTYANSPCSSSDFVLVQSFDYGNCFTFNSGRDENGSDTSLLTAGAAGPNNGMDIELFSGDPDDEMVVHRRGFYIVVHNQSATPIMENEGIHVSTGMQTSIGVNRAFYFKKSEPYSECIENTSSSDSSPSRVYKAIIELMNQKSYRQRYCFKLCYQQAVIDECLCYDPKYPNAYYQNKTLKPCFRMTDRKCIERVNAAFVSEAISDRCKLECPEECVSLMYSTSVSLAAYPTDIYLDWLTLQESLTDKIANKATLATHIRKSVAKINVFYNEIYYTAYTETPVTTWDSLLGNIGGQLGLFLGISLLSMVEILEFSLEIMRVVYYHVRYSEKEKNSIPLQDVLSWM